MCCPDVAYCLALCCCQVDNRSQVPVSKEVNLLQEALHGMEEDKVSGECLQAVTVCGVTLKMDMFFIVIVFFLAV